MPSPFPGMDPFLESPAFFPDLHDRMITRISETLQGRLPEPYYAVVGSRILIQLLDDEHRETHVEIYSRHEPKDRLVSAIEVLSLANKTPGSHGRDLYLRKQEELIEGACNLIEVDLLRGGCHATAVPVERLLEVAGALDYHVCIHRGDDPESFLVHAFRIEEPLPEVAIPLLPGDGEVALDLQSLFTHCYDAGPYLRRAPYASGLADPPIDPARAEWAAGLVRARRVDLGLARG